MAPRHVVLLTGRALCTVACVAGLAVIAACHGLLDVSDPTLVQDKDIANAAGANARRLDVFTHFHLAALSLARDVAVFTDEQTLDMPIMWNDPTQLLDRRDSQAWEAYWTGTPGTGYDDPHLGGWDDIVFRSSVAIPQIRALTPDSIRGDYLAELFAFRSYAILQMAEDICSGFPINDVSDNIPVYVAPYTTDSAVKYALVQLDSVLAEVHDSAAVLNFARVMRGRALLNLGRYAEAATAVATVPTDFTYKAGGPIFSYGLNPFPQPYIWDPTDLFELRLAVGDTEGTNGLPFVSAQDPRIPTIFRVTRYNNSADSLYDELKYIDATDPMVLASGIEARLIEAEAAIQAGDPSWFSTLNTLRATMIAPAMPPIPAMPVMQAAQIDLLYSERAFWLYLTGRRLGDLRRLIRNYGRDPETVFPTGNYNVAGTRFGTATAIPYIATVEMFSNPHVTSGCAVR